MKKVIMIEVSAREANVLTHYAMKLAASNIHENNGWKAAARVLNEAGNSVYFPVEGSDEENELRQHGIEVKRGMAFMEPKSALQLMQSMAQDNSAFKDVPTITSLVRKMAARLGAAMPRIIGKGEHSKEPVPVDSRGSGVEGTEKAKYTEAPPIPELQSREEFERMQQQLYAPTSTAHGLTTQAPEEDVPELTPLPGTHQIFQPRVRQAQQLPGEDVDVSNWTKEISDEDKAKVAAQDKAQMIGSTGAQRDISGKLIDQQAAAQNPEEDPTKWDLEEAYRLLGIRKPVWRSRNV